MNIRERLSWLKTRMQIAGNENKLTIKPASSKRKLSRGRKGGLGEGKSEKITERAFVFLTNNHLLFHATISVVFMTGEIVFSRP